MHTLSRCEERVGLATCTRAARLKSSLVRIRLKGYGVDTQGPEVLNKTGVFSNKSPHPQEPGRWCPN